MSDSTPRGVTMMRKLTRAVAVLLAAGLVLLGGTSVASAKVLPSPPSDQPVYGCLDPVDEYGAPRECQLLIEVLTPYCDNDVPYLRYKVTAVGSPSTTASITWLNPDPSGEDVVQAGLPLEGSVLWPGAVVEDGVGVDWPGWTQLPDGSWVEGDEYDWLRPNVQVRFEVNPEATVTVAYPPSSPVCVTAPPDEVLVDNPVDPGDEATPTSQVLSQTGSESQPLLLASGVLVLLGGLVVALTTFARRRSAEQ